MAIESSTTYVTVAAPSRTSMPPAEKPWKFSRVHFIGYFWLISLGMQKFTNGEPPVPAADMPDRERFMIVEAWKHANSLCKGYILSSLEDDLYNVSSALTTSKEFG